MNIAFHIPEWLLGILCFIAAVPVLAMLWAYITFKRG
ncbi:hypothetical protein KAMFAM_223 [Bacillus phage Kamfam]|uniref:Uncharacterized protein n=2 Tax=Bastillevirus evoli TaxID=2560330 RepID=A0A024B1S2_9CAUD|nr:hypothetical protein FP76_gp151 [Bacillus phage Evoli]AHZ09943.1 hypothetical protein [Bacillus phage Evoli]AMW61973.1 hypothetical protein DNAM5_229 [Bacillus phage Vinny]ASR79675.1 hypothetical protein OTK52_221 [Bacillus phage OTooleKemple52]AXQ67335.1 hypothetical protein KAMFAM_223 [Bacillus phage Kamfam]